VTRRPGAFILLSWLVASVLTGCSYDYLLVSDPVFDTVFDVDAMTEQADRSIRRAPALDPEENWGNRIDSLLAADPPSTGVILTPLLFNEAPTLAARYPDLAFVLLATTEGEEPNLVTARFDRLSAFREAGRTAETHVRDTGASVALLAEAGDDEGRREIEAFEEALAPATVDKRFVYSRSPDRETIRQHILSLGEENYLWAIFLRENTPFALDLVSSRSGAAIAEDLGPGEGYGRLVLGSVERDYFEALHRGIDALQRRQRGPQEGETLVLGVSALFVSRSRDE